MDSVVEAVSSMATDPITHQVAAADYDDDDRTSEEDVCSICLEAFDSYHNPPTVTTCKHEFHLQCILEWSQRSKECPICWQLTVLKDPASQELLSMVEDERSMRSVVTVRHIYGDPEVDHVCSVVHGFEYADSDFEEQVMRSYEAGASSMRYGSRRRKQRLSGVGSSQDDIKTSSSLMSTSTVQTSSSAGSSAGNVIPQAPENRDSSKPRVIDSQSPDGSPGRPMAADMHAFSESVKSKFSAASARYKESITKGTQGLKEKLLAKNSPVKELSRGVQREMSAGIARMLVRLDPTLKRNGDGIKSNLFKGKRTQDDDDGVAPPSLDGNSAAADGSSNALGTSVESLK
ncbi:hypothetical protein OSB04_031165 [Centaurea solstitialis]|uniref:RING-type E3 ubiquitin transferase n=1 Tax=Centaurea solstitialis TaxID=347529 RepID=A0AA38VU16_9ASTR|nr:hypothetical protein OSB04_031165 [Centaurea solstitialis]